MDEYEKIDGYEDFDENWQEEQQRDEEFEEWAKRMEIKIEEVDKIADVIKDMKWIMPSNN